MFRRHWCIDTLS